jgi:DNA-binding transcriptional ArsR family regulator
MLNSFAGASTMTVFNPSRPNLFPEVNITASSACEFVMTLYAFCTVDDDNHDFDYEIGRGWFEGVQRKLSAELCSSMKQFGIPFGAAWMDALGLIYDCTPPRDVPALLARVGAMDAFDLRLTMLGYYSLDLRRKIAPDAILRAAEGDVKAQKQFLKTATSEKSSRQRSLRLIFTLDAETMKTHMLEIMRLWYNEVYREHEAQVLPILLRDAEAKRALKPTMPPECVIEQATTGFEYVPEPSVREVLLLPTFIMRPYVSNEDYRNVQIFVYPVADESLTEDTDAPPARLVRLYKALADERRLRILQKFAQGYYTLQEIADEFKLSRSTMHHHLVILRSSGLVGLRTSDHRYHLREDTVANAPEWLAAYLKRGTET